jgi:hypothetical protein
MLMTPRKPWSDFRLNLRWSKIWTATTDESLTVLRAVSATPQSDYCARLIATPV